MRKVAIAPTAMAIYLIILLNSAVAGEQCRYIIVCDGLSMTVNVGGGFSDGALSTLAEEFKEDMRDGYMDIDCAMSAFKKSVKEQSHFDSIRSIGIESKNDLDTKVVLLASVFELRGQEDLNKKIFGMLAQLSKDNNDYRPVIFISPHNIRVGGNVIESDGDLEVTVWIGERAE